MTKSPARVKSSGAMKNTLPEEISKGKKKIRLMVTFLVLESRKRADTRTFLPNLEVWSCYCV